LPNEAKYGLLNKGGELIIVDKEIKENKVQNKPLIHDFNKESVKTAFTPKVITLLLIVVLVGVVSGYLLSNKNSASTGGASTSGQISNTGSVPKGTIEGSNDTATFKDTASGTLQTGGIDGEGAFHLVRPGGDSQNVYLTSAIVDLSKFINKNIKVWGQTQKAQHAGWLMDVGRVEVL
jgi:hypothetical protein